ncbi:MAG TPA: MFS transporter [Symbiobacteriaceae bacterium]|nr:MFS transporter [Symbiobacteriaceae bacterium]
MRRFDLYAILSGLQLGWTVWLAYVVMKGGDPGLAESAFHLTILLSEIPTGIIADRFGRRRSMLIGLGLGALASFGYVIITGTWTACLVLALSGFASTFLSGADRALLWETATRHGGEEFARKTLARMNSLQMGALAAAPIIAGLLYQWFPLSPFWTRGALSLITMVIVWGMQEPARTDWSAIPEDRAGLAPQEIADQRAPSTWQQSRIAIRIIRNNRPLFLLLLFTWGYSMVGGMVGQFGQAYFPATGLSMVVAGVAFSLSRLISAGTSHLAERLDGVRARRILQVAPLAQAVLFLAMGWTGGLLGAAAFIMGEALDGFISPTLDAEVNRVIPDAQRATILSLQSAGYSLLMTFTFPLASQLPTIPMIYQVTGLVAIVIGTIWFLRRPQTVAVAA